MSDLPAKYHFHELNKLLGDYSPTGDMPCWHCDEPEAHEIRFAFAKMVTAIRIDRSRDTTVVHDTAVKPTEREEPAVFDLTSENLFMLRDYVLSGEKLVTAAIKAAGGVRALAHKLDIHPQAIKQWKRVPAERLQAVAKASGWPQHVLRPDLFDVSAPQFYWTEEEADEIWKWSHAWQMWLALPYPPGFLPARCCARRPQLTLVVNRSGS